MRGGLIGEFRWLTHILIPPINNWYFKLRISNKASIMCGITHIVESTQNIHGEGIPIFIY